MKIKKVRGPPRAKDVRKFEKQNRAQDLNLCEKEKAREAVVLS